MQNLNYEIVNLNEKILASLKPTRLKNSDPEISQKIEFVWHNFMEKYSDIKNKVTGRPIATYSNYESDEKGTYDCSVGCEVTNRSEVLEGLELKIIPQGKYAKFIVKGPMVTAVSEFWQNLWKIDLPRKFECDFEECQNMDMLNAEVHIFISIT